MVDILKSSRVMGLKHESGFSRGGSGFSCETISSPPVAIPAYEAMTTPYLTKIKEA